MSTTDLVISAILPNGDPASDAYADIVLVTAGIGATVGAWVVVERQTLQLGSTGSVTVSLTPNSEITTPANTYYIITVLDARRTILLPVSDDPVPWSDPDILVEDPDLPNVTLPDDTLGVLDPDTLRAALVEMYASFGLSEVSANATADFLLLAVTDQPTDPHNALINTSKLLAALFASSTWLTDNVSALVLADDTLGILDPDTIEAAIDAWFDPFGLSGDDKTAAVALLAGIVTGQPSTPQDAFINVSKLLGLLLAKSTIAEKDITAAEEDIAALQAGGGDGASAYEIAVANGFVGDEAAWLASLVGADGDPGDPTAVADGAIPQAKVSGLVTALGTVIPNTLVDAKGDLIVGTAADAVGRLAVAGSTRRRHALMPDPDAAGGLGWRAADLRVVPAAGDYLSTGVSASSGVSAFTVNTMALHHAWLPAGAIDRIGVYHTANAVSTWRVVMYPASPTTGLPTGETLLLDAGVLDLSTGATGWNLKTVAYTIPYDGVYWLGIIGVTYTAGPSVHVVSYLNNPHLLLGSPVNTSSVGRAQMGLTYTLGSSAAPATCPAGHAWTGQLPRIHVRYA